MLVHTTINVTDIHLDPYYDSGFSTLTDIFKTGIIKPIESIGFNLIDQPISYYDPSDTSHTFFGTLGIIDIVIEFEKSMDEIYVERQNDTDRKTMDWVDDKDWRLFNIGRVKDVKLSEFANTENIDMLYGFAVRDIKPDEIKTIKICLTTGGDDIIILGIIHPSGEVEAL